METNNRYRQIIYHPDVQIGLKNFYNGKNDLNRFIQSHHAN